MGYCEMITNLVAILVMTNLVSVPCKCGWCDKNGVRIAEHVNRIGYDLKREVTTNYLPVVELKPRRKVQICWPNQNQDEKNKRSGNDRRAD